MRIIIATDPPWRHTANAEQAKMLARSLIADEHTVVWVPTSGFTDGTTTYDGIPVRPGDDAGGRDIMRWHANAIGTDLVITRGDIAELGKFGGGDFRWVAWNPGEVPDKLVLRRAKRLVVTTERERQRLEDRKIHSTVIPHGVHADYRKIPTADDIGYFRAVHNIPEDAYLISSVGENGGMNSFARVLEAFGKFHVKHPESLLYLHTDHNGPPDLLATITRMGLPPQSVRFPDPYNFYHGYPRGLMAAMYATSEVFIQPGDGILPVLEAQAVGCPVIAIDRPEMAAAMGVSGLGAVVPPVTWEGRRALMDTDATAAELELAYAMDDIGRGNHRDACRMFGKTALWDTVYETRWRKFLRAEQREIDALAARVRVTTPGQPETAIIEDRGATVRKYDLGTGMMDEQAQNAIVRSWGSHPNVVPILDEGEDEFGHYWFDTPKGVPLDQIESFTEEEADGILADLRAGLAFMHEHGTAHRDICPKNVLLIDGRAVIFDFDFILSGLEPEIAHLCDYDPLHPRAKDHAVPIMAAGRATRGYHRVVTHVRGLPQNNATSKPDYPYQMVDGVGERDCSIRWDLLKPEVEGKRVLDLGTNMGYFAARSIAEGAADVLAIDQNPEILVSARKLHPEVDGRFVELNLDEHMPEGEFDVAFCLSVWQHLSSGSRPLLDYLKSIPVVYWEDANLSQSELEAAGFTVERIGHSDRARNLFRLTSRAAVPA